MWNRWNVYIGPRVSVSMGRRWRDERVLHQERKPAGCNEKCSRHFYNATRHNNNSTLVGICRIMSHSLSITAQRIFFFFFVRCFIDFRECAEFRIFSRLLNITRQIDLDLMVYYIRPFPSLTLFVSTARENEGSIDRLRAEPSA